MITANGEKAYEQGLSYLKYRDRTRKEMEKYLLDKGYSESAILYAIDKMKGYHYIDDGRYLKNYFRDNLLNKRLGRKRVFQDLKKRGIGEKGITAFDNAFSTEQEIQCLEYHFTKLLKKYQHESFYNKKRKLYGALGRKGFDSNLIQEALNQLENDDEVQQDDSGQAIEPLYHKYMKMQRAKGYTGYELEQRVIRNLASKGFSYDAIREMINRDND